MSDDPFPLAAEFPASDAAHWRKLTEAALKGADFDKRLVGKTYDELRVEPLYPRSHAAPVSGRAAVPWQVLTRADHPDPAAANAQALDDLENGATGLALVLAGAPAAHGYGVVAGSTDDLQRVLDKVTLDFIPLRIETAPFAGRPVATMMTDIVARAKADASALAIDFGLDPVGDMARTGHALLPWPDLSARAAGTVSDLAAKGFDSARFLRADGRAVHDAGGSEAQELAFALASGVAYLRLLEAHGFTLDRARHRLSFILAADDDQFLTIVKFRALRKLWARVEEACGLTPEPAFVAAETAWRMMTRRDPWVNMLRTTIAVAAAGIGGADSVTVLPFTQALGLPNAFARRVARNMQFVLIEESSLAKVADPAAGSGGIEALTDGLARTAWALMQDIEKAGGAAAAVEQGLIQKQVAATRAARETAVARRKDALTGASDYPNLTEAPVDVLDVKPIVAAKADAKITFEALPAMRLAEPFEALRDRSDAILKKTGARPKVFLANLGKVSAFTARATFARNFYEAGGIEAVVNDGFLSSAREAVSASPLPPRSGGEGQSIVTDIAALVAAFKESGAKLACLCSSDKVYETDAAPAAQALTAAGATVHLAGRPGDHEAAWTKAGVKGFIFAGSDVLATLRAAYDILSS
ncbi:MAG: Methylmalonyl-CoA mutase small subunit, MutA [Pseudolabrys sp.]|nr:Methylmalonyl-CoA mutase small subunit, MutA [Pseudolabrys sp.]